MAKKRPHPYKVELISDAISISLSYDLVGLRKLLMGIARCDEMRQQLVRRRSGSIVRLIESVDDVKIDGVHDRYYNKYQIRLQEGERPLEDVPLNRWAHLSKKLGLYIQKDAQQLEREIQEAEEYIRYRAPDKLVRSLRQFIFEALHAGTGAPVSKAKRKELEKIGTMVDKCFELRLAGKLSPASLRRGDKRELEDLIGFSVRVIGRKRAITYDAVAKHLQTEFEFVPVLTGENLRKAVSHHGLDWKAIKKRKTGK